MSKISENIDDDAEELNKALYYGAEELLNRLDDDSVEMLFICKGEIDIEDENAELLSAQLYQEITENKIIKVKGFDIEISKIHNLVEMMVNEINNPKTCIKRAYKKTRDKLLADKEKELMNDDIVEVLKNKTEPTAEPTKPKGLRV